MRYLNHKLTILRYRENLIILGTIILNKLMGGGTAGYSSHLTACIFLQQWMSSKNR